MLSQTQENLPRWATELTANWPAELGKNCCWKLWSPVLCSDCQIFTYFFYLYFFVQFYNKYMGLDLKPIMPCSVKMWGPIQKIFCSGNKQVSKLVKFRFHNTPPPEARERRGAPSELLNAATRHKSPSQAKKCCAAVQHSLACEGPFLWGACSAKHAEHAWIRLSNYRQSTGEWVSEWVRFNIL